MDTICRWISERYIAKDLWPPQAAFGVSVRCCLFLLAVEAACSMSVETDFVASGGAELATVSVGIGSPMVILAGGPGFGSRYLRNPLTEELAAHYRLVFFDYRGTGSSTDSARSAHTMGQYSRDLDTVRQSITDGPVDLLAHSFGGLLAIYYASEFPQHVRRIVLIDPDPLTYSNWREFRNIIAARRTAQQRQRIAAVLAIDGWQNDPVQVQSYFDALLAPYFANKEYVVQLDLGIRENTYSQIARTNSRMRSNLGDWDYRHLAATIAAPTLVVTGDESIFPSRTVTDFVTILKDARHVKLYKAGHFPFIEQPNTITRAVLDFLRPEPILLPVRANK